MEDKNEREERKRLKKIERKKRLKLIFSTTVGVVLATAVATVGLYVRFSNGISAGKQITDVAQEKDSSLSPDLSSNEGNKDTAGDKDTAGNETDDKTEKDTEEPQPTEEELALSRLPQGLSINKETKTITITTSEGLLSLNSWYEEMCALSATYEEYDPADWSVELGADIDMQDVLLSQPVSIGYFKIFNGKFYKILNVSLFYEEVSDSVGLFKDCPSAQDITLQNVTVEAPNCENVGIFAGEPAGEEYSNISIENSTASGETYVGGLFGKSETKKISLTSVSVSDCNLSGEIAGGLVGYCSDGDNEEGAISLSDCSVEEIVFDTSEGSGGLFGELVVGGTATVSGCVTTALTQEGEALVASSAGKMVASESGKVSMEKNQFVLTTTDGKSVMICSESSGNIYLASDNALYANEGTLLENGTFYEGHYYRVFKLNFTSWDDAEKYCEQYSGYLATITSAEEQAVVSALVSASGNSCWLGAYADSLSDSGNKNFHWITGEEFGYQNWASGEPNASGVHLQMYTNGTWDDCAYKDAGSGKYFVCEWNLMEVFSSSEEA
jgi:hypothetical protein